jgi:hypothetical protein
MKNYFHTAFCPSGSSPLFSLFRASLSILALAGLACGHKKEAAGAGVGATAGAGGLGAGAPPPQSRLEYDDRGSGLDEKIVWPPCSS